MRSVVIVAALIAASARAAVLGPDAPACASGGGPAILATVEGLKDRQGDIALELYPPTDRDFLRGDRDLVAEGKTFRRVRVPAPATSLVQLCIRVPRAGAYALLFTHNRDGRTKFSFWTDGAGVPGNVRIGRARPKLDQALVHVGEHAVVSVTIRAQYLRGLLSGFAP